MIKTGIQEREPMTDMILNKLTCPVCSSRGAADRPDNPSLAIAAGPPPGLACGRCGAIYPVRDGIIDFVGHEPERKINLSQHAMEFRPLITLYERFWRPLVTRPFSSLAWEMDTSLRLLDLKPDDDVLDIACGPGNFTRLIASELSGGGVAGIDLSLPMLKKAVTMPAKAEGPAITYLRVDVTKWVFAPGSFDRIHCAGALHLFPDLQNVFNSMARSLKPGGIFVGATYLTAPGRVKRKFQDYVSYRSGMRWFQTEELRDVAARAGFIMWKQEILKQGIVFRVRKK